MKIIEREETAALTERWTPDFLDNLDHPEAERAGFVVRKLSAREIERISREKSAKVSRRRGTKAGARAEARLGQDVVDAIFDAAIVSLFGWSLEKEGGETVAIEGWRTLRTVLFAKASLGLAPKEMFDALFVHITSGTELGEKLELE